MPPICLSSVSRVGILRFESYFLKELHQEPVPYRQLISPLPLSKIFPLVSAAVSSYKTDVADPIRILQSQSADLLQAVCELREPPSVDSQFSKVFNKRYLQIKLKFSNSITK